MMLNLVILVGQEPLVTIVNLIIVGIMIKMVPI